LLEAGGANDRDRYTDTREVYQPTFALEGCITKADLFSEVWCSFDYLAAWVGVPSVSSHEDDLVKVSFRPEELARASLDGACARLMMGVEGAAGDERVDLTRWTYFAMRPVEPATVEALVDRYSRPVQDLLVLCLGRPVRLTSIRLRPKDQEDHREGLATCYFSTVQPAAARRPPGNAAAAIESYPAPTILTMRNSPVPVGALLTRWFELWPSFQETLELLLSPLYAPFMYGEHGFASTFQGAEALHKAVGLPTSDLSKVEHKARVQAVAEALDAADVRQEVSEWVARLIDGRNDKPLAGRIEDLVLSTGRVGEAVLAADPGFALAVTRARVGVSHGGVGSAKRKNLDPVDRYWLGQVLRWVVRARLMMELLDEPEVAERLVVERHSFQLAVDKVAKT
jgi:hypothetical protein